jgi:rhamnogalacturonan endolyase
MKKLLAKILFGFVCTAMLLPAIPADGRAKKRRQMENLSRGVVAVNEDGKKVFVGWRMLGTDAADIAFDVYRETRGKTVKLNDKPVKDVTFFVDDKADLTQPNSYFVRVAGKNEPAATKYTLPANPEAKQYLSVPLKTPPGYTPNDASVGDLDGDGDYEIVLHQVGRGRDNSFPGFTTEPVLQAYRLDGTLLWTIDLGKNIREGAHYTQFIVYDLDGDGRAEIACKTADGTIDGKGKIIGDANADWRAPEGAFAEISDPRGGAPRRQNIAGKILSGPEYLSIFDGETGAELATTKFVPPRHPAKLDPTADELNAVWGDGTGNRVDRFLAAVAYLDGERPSLIMTRGYYTRSVLAAWDYRDKKISLRWVFDSDAGGAENRKFRGQGNHNLSVGDIDADGRDEIVFGAMVVDDDGKGLYSTGLGHGDAMHLSDLDPDRSGLEVFGIQERFDDAGAHFRDARTGEILWKKQSVKAGDDGEGPGRGLALDIDPRRRGFESWVRGAGIDGLFSAKGEKISDRAPDSCNFGVYWDGDTLSELLDRNRISKWNWTKETTEPLFTAADALSNNGTKATPVLSADIFGDWREEVIWRTRDNRELRIYTTVIPTAHRFYTFMHDAQYRLSIAWQNVGYNQPPHTSFFVGEGMKPPPRPLIRTTARRR